MSIFEQVLLFWLRLLWQKNGRYWVIGVGTSNESALTYLRGSGPWLEGCTAKLTDKVQELIK